jgi:hypothetical protein
MLEPAVLSNQPRRKLTYEIVHVTETREQIKNEGPVVDVELAVVFFVRAKRYRSLFARR